jgi:TerC family integral membrane protein
MQDEFQLAARKTALAVAAAGCFGVLLHGTRGPQAALEFASGYLVEQSLSVDNLFVFIMLFDYFKVPRAFQGRVLNYGILGAVLMRGFMIVAGVAAVQKFRWMTLLFAGILLLSAIKLLLESDDDDDDEVNDRLVMRIARKVVGPIAEYDGDRFFTTSYKDGKSISAATPLLLCLVCVELSDVVFAVDSIPAVLGISTDPLVVYSSNIFAIIGLRALYTLVARAVDSLAYLKHAVCAVLVFIALKMIGEYFEYHVSTGLSLVVVGSLLALGVLVSCVARPRKKRKDDKDDFRQYPHAFEPPSPMNDLLKQRGNRNGYSAPDDLARVMV